MGDEDVEDIKGERERQRPARVTLSGNTEQHPDRRVVVETVNDNNGGEIPYSYFTSEAAMQNALRGGQQGTPAHDLPALMPRDPNRRDETIKSRKTRQTTLDADQRKKFNYDLGDSIFQKPPEDTERIFFQNVNGISPKDEWQDASEIGYMARQQWISIMALAETNVDWKKGKARSKCVKKLNAFWTGAKVGTASSLIDHGSVYQPGGVLQLMGNEWSTRVTRTEEDPWRMGRWIAMTMQGKGGKAITFICAYQVVNDKGSIHRPRTAYKQQWMMLRNSTNPDPDPRKAFVRDLMSTIKKERDRGNEVILMLDANDYLTGPKSPLGQALREASLVDVYQHVHAPHDELADELATHNRGTKCIDFIYASAGILPHVKRCGITAFQEGVTFSDHRGIFIDVNLRSILGSPQMLLPKKMRGVQCNHPAVVKKYTPAVQKYMDDHKVEQRAAAMKTPTEIEGVDKDVTRAMLHAQRKHGNRFATPWSSKLIKAKKLVRYWKLWLCEIRTGRDLSFQRAQLVKGMDNQPTHHNKEDGPGFLASRKELKAATKALRAILANAAKYRDELLLERIEAACLGDLTKKANIERRIRAQEASRAKFRRIQNTLRRKQNGGIEFIMVQDEADSTKWRSIFDQEEIVARLMDRNKTHFGQAHGTPFTIGTLRGLFEWSGNTENGDRVVDGTFQVSEHDLDEATESILRHLNDTTTLPEIDDKLTEHDIRQGFKRWKEGTATSQDRHLGLYKALMAYEKQEYDEEGNELPKTSTAMYTVLAQVINAANSQGYVLSRWRRVTNAMIEKIPGKPRIDKLRVIHLFEADFNLFIGILWGRRLMWNAEDHGYLSDEQWGGRGGRMCSDVVLLKHFTYLFSHLTKTTLGTFDNDAKSCYDRIIVSLAMLISRIMGMSRNATETHAEFLRQAEYHLKTKLGVSDECYSNLMAIIYGTGQGSRASPAFWTIISSVIIELIRKKSDGVTLASSDMETHVRRWMDGFVDDTTAWINRFVEEIMDEFAQEDSIAEKIVGDLADTSQWWEQLLYSTGGKLELSKCLYYVLSWQFDEEGRASLRPQNAIPGRQITVTSSAGEGIEEIKHVDCKQAHKTLGVMECPALVYTEEYARLQNKVTALTRHLVVDPMYPGDAVTMYQSIMIPSVGYSLVAMSFSRAELDSLNGPALNLVLTQMGYNRKAPRAVVHGPEYYGGIGLQSFHVKMGTDKVLALLRHLRHQGKVGKAIRICMDWFQLIAGISFDSFRDPARLLPYAVGDWFPSLRDFLADSELNLLCTAPLYMVTLRRINDVVLMEKATGKYSDTEIKTINRVRLFLRVETLADCVDVSGRYLLRGAVVSHKTAGVESFPTRFWPRQARPGPKSWAVWKRFIRQFTVDRDDRTIQLRLRTPLGEWLDTRDRRWPWSIDSVSHTVVHTTRLTPVTFKQAHYPITEITRRGISFQDTIIADTLEDAELLTPTTRLGVSTNRVAATDGYRVPTHRNTVEPRDLNQFFRSLDPWERQLLEGNQEGVPGRLLEWLIEHTQDVKLQLIMCHDGGHRTKYGSFGWVISDGRYILWKGWGPAVGHPMQSFRAEAYGRLAAVCFLRRFIEFYAIELPSLATADNISIALSYTDSKSLLDRLVKHATRHVDSSFDRLQNDSDVIFEIAATEKAAGININGAWVKGHQDDTMDYADLPFSAQLNVLADELATHALTEHEDRGNPHPMLPLPSTGVYLGLDEGGLVTSRERGLIQRRIPETEMRDFLMDKYEWDMEIWNMIDWDAFKSARSGLRKGQGKFVIKWTTKWLAVSRRTQRYGQGDAKCKQCGLEEDYDHLIQCPQRSEWRDRFATRLDSYLKKQDTEPAIRTLIRDGFKEWMLGIPYRDQTKFQSNRENLSWHHAARGYFHKGLTKEQERYYRVMENRHKCEAPDSIKPKYRSKDGYSGHQWMTKLIRFIWKELQELWTSRNTSVHGDGIQSQQERENLIRTVETLYNTSTALCQHDRVIFDVPREEIQQLRTSDLRIWVRDASQIVKAGLRDARFQEKRGVQDIRNFFLLLNPLPAVQRLLSQTGAGTHDPPQAEAPD